jgi:glucokinase
MKQLSAGVDIGGTNTVIGLVDPEGNVLAKSTISTTKLEVLEDYVNEVSDEINKHIKALQPCDVVGLGIGAPNGNYYNGTIEFAPNLRWKGVLPLRDLFSKHFSFPVFLTNDANAAAIGEMVYGNARGMKDFIIITLGTGIGSGIVANGSLIYGHDGFAGEIGHTILYAGGRPCGCGRNGCVEAYCSAKGIVKTYLELLQKNNKTAEIPTAQITPKYIFDKACVQEKEAVETYHFTGKTLGLTLANSVAYTSPEAIFLFGGIANAGELLLKPLKESFEENLLVIYKNKIDILISGIKENDAAILGAASLAWNEIIK